MFGLEAQGNWADLSGSNTSLFFGAPFANRSKIEAFGLFTGQIGYAWNNALLYVKGGAAVTDDKYRGFINAPIGGLASGTMFDRASETRWGGTVGVGLEYGFAPNWSMAIEYDHLFMGDRNVTMTSTGAIRPGAARFRGPTTSVRTSISSPCASTIAGVARSSRSTDLRFHQTKYEKAGLAPAFLFGCTSA